MSKFLDLDGLSYYTSKIKTTYDPPIEMNNNNILLNLEAGYLQKNLYIPTKSIGTTYTGTGYAIEVKNDYSISVDAVDIHMELAYIFGKVSLYKGKSYVITGIPEGGSDSTYFIYIAGGLNINYKTNGTVITPQMDYIEAEVWIYVRANITISDTFYPMIVEKSVYDAGATGYAPYTMSNTQLTDIIQSPATNTDIKAMWDNS